jgi:hypothetical protein
MSRVLEDSAVAIAGICNTAADVEEVVACDAGAVNFSRAVL